MKIIPESFAFNQTPTVQQPFMAMSNLNGVLKFPNQIKPSLLLFRGEIWESRDLALITMSGRDLLRISSARLLPAAQLFVGSMVAVPF